MLQNLEILFEDNHVLAVVKPAGMLSQGDLTGDLDILSLAKQTIKRRDSKPGNVYLGLVHRLDRPVGGVMVVAKTSKAASRLSAQFRDRTTKKIYWAVVHGSPREEEALLRHRLRKDKSRRVTCIVGQHEEGKNAELNYRVLELHPDKSLIEIELITGLSHQIRAQLSGIGHPILGDLKYGAAAPLAGGNIALLARSITFSHPIRKNPITAVADPPSNWPWP